MKREVYVKVRCHDCRRIWTALAYHHTLFEGDHGFTEMVKDDDFFCPHCGHAQHEEGCTKCHADRTQTRMTRYLGAPPLGLGIGDQRRGSGQDAFCIVCPKCTAEHWVESIYDVEACDVCAHRFTTEE